MIYPAPQNSRSGMLNFHRIDLETLAQAIAQLNKIADKHAKLLQHDHVLAGGLLHYENLLIDAQGGDSAALKEATTPDEFDKVLELAEKRHVPEPQDDLDYLDMRKDLLRFKSQFLSASHPN